MGKNRRREKNRARLCIFYILINILIYLLQWMQGNIYREVFPTFLAKKSYGWWITRRRMEMYTKISEENISCGVGRTEEISHQRRMGWCEFRTRGRCCANFAQAWAAVRNSHMLGAVVFQRPYLPHFSSKSYTV